MKRILLVAALLLPTHGFANTMITAPPSVGTVTTYTFTSSIAYSQVQPVLGSFAITGVGLVSGNGLFAFGDGTQGSIAGNGSWSPYSSPFPWFGTGKEDSTARVVIDLNGLYSSAGGFMNYNPAYATYIAVLDSTMQLLGEQYLLAETNPISSPGAVNQGAFRGISRPQADIRYLVFGGGPSAMHSITVSVEELEQQAGGETEAPEPATLGVAFLGLAGVAIARRRIAAR